ncbi:DUF2069 domain-containing protein [Paraburkholderia sp. Cy-641]|nr:DUF2069 domain-containing protein [Paraburkholderia sp. Cy-641]
MNDPDLQPAEREDSRRATHAHRAESRAANPPSHAANAPHAAQAPHAPLAAGASLHATAVPVQPKTTAARVAAVTLVAMIALAVTWEGWLAPLRPGGSLLVLKALPLLSALPGVWRRRLYTLQWASMLILLYFAEGVVRGWSDHGLSARLGWLQAVLAVIFFASTLAYVGPFKRAAKRRAKQAAAEAANGTAGSETRHD